MSGVFAGSTGLTQEMIDEVRALVGQRLRIEQYNHEATYDTIRHYALGIGDDNPLWCDEDYAARGPHGTMVAPPTFLFSVFAPGIAPGLAGLQPFQAGTECVWHRLPRRGERIRAEATFTGFDEHQGRHSQRMLIQHGEVRYTTGAGELLSVIKSHSYRTVRREGGEGGLAYEALEEQRYTEAELDAIERDIRAEEVRGPRPRYWEDVQVGDALMPVVKGPLDRTTMTVYYAGCLATSGYKASEVKWKQQILAREHPELLVNNYDRSYFAERVLPSLGHQDNSIARAIGMPGAYDNGHQRMGWNAHLITNWMGDTGFLAEMNVRIRRPNIFGNTTWFRGEVREKLQYQGKPAVRLETWADDQRGTRNTTGSAIVVLPSRG